MDRVLSSSWRHIYIASAAYICLISRYEIAMLDAYKPPLFPHTHNQSLIRQFVDDTCTTKGKRQTWCHRRTPRPKGTFLSHEVRVATVFICGLGRWPEVHTCTLIHLLQVEPFSFRDSIHASMVIILMYRNLIYTCSKSFKRFHS